MRCPGCATENSDTARFCQGCGVRLASEGAEAVGVPPPVPAGLHPEGENRVVTLLFADMASSVEATRDLDAEDAAALVNELLQAMVAALAMHGGRVDHFLGDGLLGVFGIPEVCESDPERALLAALDLRTAAQRLGLSVRVGINTGEVYFGRVGSELYQEVTVMGPAVNVAARLEEAAAPDQIVVGEGTYRQTRGAFAFVPFQLAVKGLPGPLSAYSLQGRLLRPGKARGIEGRATPLVGRAAELAALRRALSEAAAGRGQLVLLLGEAGVGKSRLVAELRNCGLRIADPGLENWDRTPPDNPQSAIRDPQWTFLEGRCLERDVAASYGPFVDALRQCFGWGPEADEAERAGRLRGTLEDLDPGRAEEIAWAFGHLLASGPGGRAAGAVASGAPGEPAHLRHRIFRALRDFFLALARRGPLVLVLEDLHWADSLSLELAALLVEVLPASPILLVAASRPEPEAPWRQLAAAADRSAPGRCTALLLAELGAAAGGELVAALLPPGVVEPSLQEQLLAKSRGNPFFLEELVRSLLDAGALEQEAGEWRVRPGAGDIGVPESVQSLIQSRVDRLDPARKRLLQQASVIGRVFRPRVLAALAPEEPELEPALAELAARGLVVRERAAPEAEYAFKHVLIQEAVYATILRRHRVALHQRVVEQIEALYPAAPEFCEELAEHALRGGRPEKAAGYLLAAARKAQSLYANQEAARWYERALAASQAAPDPAAELAARAGLGETRFWMGDHRAAEAQFEAARALVPAADPRGAAALTCQLADAVQWQAQPERAIVIAGEGLAALGEDRFNPEAVNLLEVLMRSCWARGDLDGARRYAAELEALLPAVPYFDAVYQAYYGLAWVALRSRDLAAADGWLRTMEQVCLERRNEIGLARCYHGLGDVARARDDFGAAAEWFARSLACCERTGDAHLLMEGHLERAHALLMAGGDAGEAERHAARGLALADEMIRAGGSTGAPGLCDMIGRAYLERGALDPALRYFGRALEFGRHPDPAGALRNLEQLYARAGQPDAFRAFCERTGHAGPPATEAASGAR
jgi:class 3 adenylate cyclase/tetratricopeptide (TPR) repeat protein